MKNFGLAVGVVPTKWIKGAVDSICTFLVGAALLIVVFTGASLFLDYLTRPSESETTARDDWLPIEEYVTAPIFDHVSITGGKDEAFVMDSIDYRLDMIVFDTAGTIPLDSAFVVPLP
jgi:hypothetical protein